jgi:prolyl 4-hydroxylase
MSTTQPLPAEWMTWVTENVARNCAPADMMTILMRDGGFPEHLARAALARSAGKIAQFVALPSPVVDDNHTTILGRRCPIALDVVSPRIVVVQDFLSDAECDALTMDIEGKLKRSTVVNNDGGNEYEMDARTSSGTFYHRGATPLVTEIEARLADFAQWPIENGEGLQILFYSVGGEYRPHFDWFDPMTVGGRNHMHKGGQRVATQILYLSDVEAGGATTFPKLGLSLRPKKGAMLFFTNLTLEGEPDQMALHGGAPVVRGTKLIATKWLRSTEY